MGEAAMKQAELERALEAAKQPEAIKVQLKPNQIMVLILLDIAMHGLQGVADVLGKAIGETKSADEVMGAIAHLTRYKIRYFEQCRTGIVLATAADMPPPLVQP